MFNGGKYTAADGTVVKHDDLPSEVKKEVEWRAGMRDLAQQAGDLKGNPHSADVYQKQINRLYDPTTRNEDMERITGAKIVSDLNARLGARDKK